MIKVVVGSKNIVKIKAVENVFKKVFGDVEIQSIKTDPGVSPMPSSWEEIAKGAINRAKNALKKIPADFGVGLEGGYEETKFGVFLSGAVAIIDKNGKLGISKGGGVILPKRIVKKLKQGKELGEVMDEIQGIKNSKQKGGAIGFFTKNYSTRQKSFETIVLYALARFLRREIYEK